MTHTRIAHLSIDSEALRHNLQRVKVLAPDSKIMAVIKANAYGHGVHIAADALSEADAFALATPNEALTLRQSGVSKPLVVFQGFSNADELKALADLDIQAVVHQGSQIDLLEQCAGLELDVWLKLDTGMHRLGIPVEMAEVAYQRLKGCESVASIRLMTHFANADDLAHPMNAEQLSVFTSMFESLGLNDASMANSAALIEMPESRMQWVRPGIMLYGSSPLLDKTADELDLKPVMQFESKLIAVQDLKQGDAIGYGSTWQCPEDMKVGVVAAGYADGYPRHAESGTPVWINGTLCPLVGRVSMDSICIDLRGVEARAGDRVVLWGKELSVDVVAERAQTISYELLCHAGACLLTSGLLLE
ncbi:MAG: alanine racemase [Gammaproteobacteria bacterium]|nr:alanine racemase [Gammaproteobacteria bacterium]MCW8923049.1 alanine racemase [Gammaproteobacteria bacterium]